MSYRQERRVFDRLKKDITPKARQEYENACNILIERYNTTIRENRFTVGGAVEVFTCALLRTVGIDCNLYSEQSTHGDLILPNHKLLSIKGVFTGGADNVGILNKQGKGTRDWTTATLFIVSEVGIVYGTPDMVSPEHLKDKPDQLMLHKKGLTQIISDAKNIVPMELSKKPPTEMAGFAQKASVAVAKQIMRETESELLIGAFMNKEALNPTAIRNDDSKNY